MARLIYTTIASLDGYVNDAAGGFQWAAPDRKVHSFVNDLERDVGTYLTGRRLHDVMAYWQSAPTEDSDDPDDAAEHDYARTLEAVSGPRTRLERHFDPAAVATLVASADRDVSIGGPTLAAEALRAGIVDELRLLTVPVVVGGGTRTIPDGIRLDLELLEHRRFAGGTTYARYAVT